MSRKLGKILLGVTPEQIAEWFLEDPEIQYIMGAYGIQLNTRIRENVTQSEQAYIMNRIMQHAINLRMRHHMQNIRGFNDEMDSDSDPDNMPVDVMSVDSAELRSIGSSSSDAVEDAYMAEADVDAETGPRDGFDVVELNEIVETAKPDTIKTDTAETAKPDTIKTDMAETDTTTAADTPDTKPAANPVVPLDPQRCARSGCARRLKILDMACRCGARFCPIHKHFADHDCTFDYKTEFRKEKEKEKETSRSNMSNRFNYSGRDGGGAY